MFYPINTQRILTLVNNSNGLSFVSLVVTVAIFSFLQLVMMQFSTDVIKFESTNQKELESASEAQVAFAFIHKDWSNGWHSLNSLVCITDQSSFTTAKAKALSAGACDSRRDLNDNFSRSFYDYDPLAGDEIERSIILKPIPTQDSEWTTEKPQGFSIMSNDTKEDDEASPIFISDLHDGSTPKISKLKDVLTDFMGSRYKQDQRLLLFSPVSLPRNLAANPSEKEYKKYPSLLMNIPNSASNPELSNFASKAFYFFNQKDTYLNPYDQSDTAATFKKFIENLPRLGGTSSILFYVPVHLINYFINVDGELYRETRKNGAMSSELLATRVCSVELKRRVNSNLLHIEIKSDNTGEYDCP